MTQQEIMEMARQAGSIDSENVILTVYNAFAAKERLDCFEAAYNAHATTAVLEAIQQRGEA